MLSPLPCVDDRPEAVSGFDPQCFAGFESVGPRIRINPLAHMSAEDLRAYARVHDLPVHPLTEQGYRSIGCMPCTRPVGDDEDQRAGRWAGSEKTECGIHLTGLTDSLKRIPKSV